MKKVNLFLILFFLSIFILVSLLIAGSLFSSPTTAPDQRGWMDTMWGCMGSWVGGNSSAADPFWVTYGILLVVGIGILILGIAGLMYFYLFPEIRNIPQTKQIPSEQATQDSSPYESVLKTLNDDERKVLNVLKKRDGKYLQKYIRHEAGLSRLKTHRVLARFAERGMVTLQKTGNTNEVTLAEWLK